MTTPNIITTVLVAATAQFRGGAPLDLCDLADVKDEMKIATQEDDAWLRKQIKRESATISTFCNRVFQVQTYQDHVWPFRDSAPRRVEPDIKPLQLTRWPVANDPSPAGIAPPLAPALSSVSGGALAAARYYGRVSYVTASGETAASLETLIAIAAGALPSVASPAADSEGLAIGWNCYLATQSCIETLQNAAPLPIGTAFTLPGDGLAAGAALPNCLFVEEAGVIPRPLAEGIDFLIDAAAGQIVRLHRRSGVSRSWSSEPVLLQYRAGFAEIPDDIQDAAIQLVKYRWFARGLDPAVKSDNVEGVYSADRWFGTGPGGYGDLPNYIAEKLERYRVPVIA